MRRAVKGQRTRLGDLLPTEEQAHRPRLTRGTVLETALAAIDERGLEAATMRGLAERLGVTARALYRHVCDKDDLLRGVAGLILSDMRLPLPSLPWRERLSELISELRRVMVAHPHAVPLFGRSATSAPQAIIAITDAVVGALREAGLDGDRAVRAFYALFNYTLGFTLAEGEFRTTPPQPLPDSVAAIDRTALPSVADVAPFLLRFAGEGLFAADDQWAFGLDLMLDSIARRAEDGAG